MLRKQRNLHKSKKETENTLTLRQVSPSSARTKQDRGKLTEGGNVKGTTVLCQENKNIKSEFHREEIIDNLFTRRFSMTFNLNERRF